MKHPVCTLVQEQPVSYSQTEASSWSLLVSCDECSEDLLSCPSAAKDTELTGSSPTPRQEELHPELDLLSVFSIIIGTRIIKVKCQSLKCVRSHL